MPSSTEEKDVRDEIVDHLKKNERSMRWLSEKTKINYSSLYSMLKERTFKVSPENLKKINSVLKTSF
jgi:lambda repressor-like predicted transcriptional regulator